MRELAPQVLGVLTRRFADFDSAEDPVQEALVAAAERWTHDGVPERPRGWLIQTAERRLIDHYRSELARRQREAISQDPVPEFFDQDDTLIILFMCCHPALTDASAIALTLRAVGGLSTAEIAKAFLVDEPTMAQRISRAKRRIRSSGEPFRMPTAEERPARLRNVLHVLYLIFNEGYAASGGSELQRTELSAEAIRLARMLPDEPEVDGLLALMLLLDARRAARTDADGELVPLPQQDRSLWDQARIAEGLVLLEKAAGEYQVQAAIAAVHDRAPSAGATDWRQILGLYEQLERMTGNPVVTLNRAVATAMADGPGAGLAVLDDVDARLDGHHRLDAVRAHLLEMAGDFEVAIEQYRAAAQKTTNVAEQRYLRKRAARLKKMSQ